MSPLEAVWWICLAVNPAGGAVGPVGLMGRTPTIARGSRRRGANESPGIGVPDGCRAGECPGSGAGTMGSEVRSGVLGWKFCASTSAAPPWGGGEVGSLLLELRQVGGELDDLLEVGLVDLAALGMVSLQELGLLSAVSAGAV